MPKITYHIGAGSWSLTVEDQGTTTVFDIAAMDRHERGRFFAELRKVLKKRYTGDTRRG